MRATVCLLVSVFVTATGVTARAVEAEIPPDGVAFGSVQVPSDMALPSPMETAAVTRRPEADPLERPARLDVKDVALEDALKTLMKTSRVPVVFSPDFVPNVTVTCACRDATVGMALDRLLAGTNLEFVAPGSQVVITRRSPEAVLASPSALLATSIPAPSVRSAPLNRLTVDEKGLQESTGTVAGRVVDTQTRQPLNVAQVFILGLNVGVLSGSDGAYSLSEVPAGTHSLTAELLGYSNQSVEVTVVAGETVIVDFDLVPQALALDELVVVGYAEQTRASLSGAVTSIDNADIQRTSATTTADMLVGKVPGINTRNSLATGGGYFNDRVASDARPGGATALQIRNMGAPLYVIDGIPSTELEFNQLNAADIDNISILKDASASVYGFRAANGVILVTTKRGDELRTPRVQVSSYYGWQTFPRNRYPSGYGDNAYQLKYSYVESEQNRHEPRTITPEELELWRQAGPGYESREMWKYFVRDDVPQWNVNSSVQGGTENSSYYLSLGHVSQDYALISDNNFSRTNLQSNLSTELFDGFTIGTELRGRQEEHTLVAITDGGSDPLLHIFRAMSTAWPFEDPFANGNPNYLNGDNHYFVRQPAIFTRDRSGTQDLVRTDFSGNFWAEYVLPFNAAFRATYSKSKQLDEYEIHRYSYDGYCYDAANDSYDVCNTYGGQSRLSQRAVADRSFWNFRVNHSLQSGSHTVSSVVAMELESTESTLNELFSVPPTNFNPLIDYVNVQDAYQEFTIGRRASYVGRVNYDFEQKYLIEAVARYDGSHLYAPGNRWGFFPGVSLAWRASEESFFQEALPFVNELKLRASWGQTGREQGVGPWDYLGGATYGSGTAGVIDGSVVTAIVPRGLPVTNLSWVESTSRNFGFDFGVLDNRLTGQFDVFERKLSGLPAGRYDVALPSELGYSLPQENLESEATLGFEGVVRYSGRIGDVAFSLAPNFTLARRKILDVYKPRFGSSWDEYLNAEQDRWVDPYFTHHKIGVFQSMEEIANYPVDIDGQGNRTLLPGDLIFEDVNNDGIIDDLDERPRGFETGTPPILSYGMNASLSYGGFTLVADFSGGGMFQYNPSNLVTVPHQTDYNGFSSLSNRWRRVDPYDDNSEWIPGKFPPLRRAQTSHSSYRNSDFSRIAVKYLRLTRLELGYAIPGQLSQRFGVNGLRVYGSVAGPLLFDNMRKLAIDPEVGRTAGFMYPNQIIVNLGFSANFGGL